jgi:hypothetical protein
MTVVGQVANLPRQDEILPPLGDSHSFAGPQWVARHTPADVVVRHSANVRA